MPTEQEPKGISTSQKEFQNLLDQDFKDLPKENEIIKATISEITKKYVIVDDLLATGGTAKCVSNILISAKKEVLGLTVTEAFNKAVKSIPDAPDVLYDGN